MKKTSSTKGNGTDAPHNHPVKTLRKYSSDFIAKALRFAVSDEVGYMFLGALVAVHFGGLAYVAIR